MRITDRMMFDNANLWTSAAETQVEAATESSSTGIRVAHASDDPAAAALIATYSQGAARATSIAQTTSRASDELQAADSALSSAGDALSRADQLAVQMANGTYSAGDRASTATEVQGLMTSIISALNTKVGTRYIFGGSKDSAPPFDAAGNYNGDTQVRQVESAPGVLQNTSIRADVAFKGAGGGTDVLATLQGLVTALQNNDVVGVQSSLTGLSDGITQLGAARASGGAAMNALDAANAVATAAATAQTTSAGNLQDANVVDAATQLQLAQRALEASVQAGTMSFQFSMLGSK
jgi:flagellar hook-associated protein 3 FlgL